MVSSCPCRCPYLKVYFGRSAINTLTLFVLERLAAHLWTHVRSLKFISTYILQPMLSNLMYMHHALLLMDNAPFLPVLLKSWITCQNERPFKIIRTDRMHQCKCSQQQARMRAHTNTHITLSQTFTYTWTRTCPSIARATMARTPCVFSQNQNYEPKSGSAGQSKGCKARAAKERFPYRSISSRECPPHLSTTDISRNGQCDSQVW